MTCSIRNHKLLVVDNCVTSFAFRFKLNSSIRQNSHRCYFTNAQQVLKDDPFVTLGLHYGATQSEIKIAFRTRAAKLHPDVNKVDEPAIAQKKFQQLSAAYEKLTKSSNGHPKLDDNEWQWSIWLRNSNIAESRTDIAGVLKVRPIPPVTDIHGNPSQPYTIGHPAGFGTVRRGEYIGTMTKDNQPSRSVGSGINKWVAQKPYQPWKADHQSTKAPS